MDNQVETNSLQRKYKITILIPTFLIVVLITIFLSLYIKEIKRPDLIIYFEENFEKTPERWELIDAKWEKTDDEGGFITLAREEYVAPYLCLPYMLENSPQQSFTWRFSTKVSSFIDDALVLGTFEFSNGDFSVVVNDEGKIGYSTNMFQDATYAQKVFGEISKDKWHEIIVHFDTEMKEVTIYLDEKKMLTSNLSIQTYPIQKVWLGATWVGGKENYGVPLDVRFDNVNIANNALVPKPSFLKFLTTKVIDLF